MVFGIGYSFVIEAPEGANVTSSRIFALAGGTVIEAISAFFLWVYSRSVTQLTYFYNRQIFNHSVLFCTTIASTMSDSEAAKAVIIDKVLSQSWDVPGVNPPRPGRPAFQKTSTPSAS